MIVSFKALMNKYTIDPENLYLLAQSIRVIDEEQEIRKAEQLVTPKEETQYEIVKAHIESLEAHNNNVEYVYKLIADLRKQLRHLEIQTESFDLVSEMLKASQYDEFLKLCEIQGVPAWDSCWWLGCIAIPMPEPPVRIIRGK